MPLPLISARLPSALCSTMPTSRDGRVDVRQTDEQAIGAEPAATVAPPLGQHPEGQPHEWLVVEQHEEVEAAYEGGQNPIHMRMRKLRGPHMKKSMPFENFRTRTQPVNVSDLEQRFDAGAEVTPESLKEKGLAKRSDPVKILARGDISKKLTVRAHAFSAAAREKIEAAGGTCETLES